MAFEADGGQAAPDFSIGSAMGAAAKYVEAGGLNQAAIAKVSAETQKLVSAAKSGGFKITAEGVKPLREALANMSEELSALGNRTTRLSEAPQLGDHPYGKAVAAHDHKGAAQASNSASAVLEQFKQVVRDADEALARAAGLYKGVEDRAIDATKKIQA
ncbi:hypothetical protein LCL61_05750 [Amycolatopsis coloradensis]|uniref:Uncharacterized protein n=1 Tax=Amycolatopsis coloradensis TaxID=76021 RepID=A0ACD5B721_9PSEU